jgi:GTP-binding protein HflX
MLFATLDPTARSIKLTHGEQVILSDTVGFISDLPTMLVAAFRATLEDVIEADVLLHVRDVSHAETAAQDIDVRRILRDLDVDPDNTERLIEVWNKADLLPADERERLLTQVARTDPNRRPALVSALTGEGIPELLALVEEHIARGRARYRLRLDPADGAALNWIYEQAEVLERADGEEGIALTVRISPEKEHRFLQRFADARRLAD